MATTDYKILKLAGFSRNFLQTLLGCKAEVKQACVHAVYVKAWTPDQCRKCGALFFKFGRGVYDDVLSPHDAKACRDAHKFECCSGACFRDTEEYAVLWGERHRRRSILTHAQESHAFFESDSWKRLRYEAIRKHGASCQACGATRRDGAVIQVDHIKPRSKHPELALTLDNLQVLCRDCNMGKSNLYEDDWRKTS